MAESPNCPDGRPGAAILQSIITEAAALSSAKAETVDARQFVDGLLRIRLRLIADMGTRISEVADVGQIQKESN
jgi:hypothetical protein